MRKNCWKYICVFILSKKQLNWFHKNLYNSGMVGRRKLPDPSLSRIFNALSISVQYTLSFQWTNSDLKCLTLASNWKSIYQELKKSWDLRKILFFSNTDIHRFLWLYSLIESLQVNRMYVTSFWFHSKLVLDKARKPVSYELAIHTVFL